MNTLFCYFYRDACNYKTFNEVIIKGRLELKELAPYLHEETYFIPSEVGLEDLQGDLFSTDDHIWHEIDSVSATDDPVTNDIHAHVFIEMFHSSSKNRWNEYDVFKRKGLI
jgi:hypothetical protein